MPDARPTHSRSTLFALWIVFCAFCHVAGWTLSGLKALNHLGYLAAFAIAAAALVFWHSRAKPDITLNFARIRRRFGRPFPLGFLALTSLAVLGGVLYEPNNFDAHAYRTPRVLHWLAEQRWHWIHAEFGSLNSRGPGIEWITAPIFLFAKTDRFEFLINTICILFLPGRIFAVLTRLGVNRRVAYAWMWIFPTGYNFILQAGSIANDMFTALWPIAAVEFALRARASGKVSHVWLSMLAAGLMTASKAFNLLLLPAWAVALFPTLRLALKRPAATLAIAAATVLSSGIPTALLNLHYCGDWTGLKIEPVRIDNGPPLFHIAVNAVLTTLYNFAPPIFPFTGAWNRLVEAAIPANIRAMMHRYFEPDAARLYFGDMQVEEAAGLGFGVSVLLLTIILSQMFGRAKSSIPSFLNARVLICLSAICGALALMAKSGLYAPARYLMPLYFLSVAPIWMLPAARQLLRAAWWRKLVLFTFALAALLIIISPARPLWPALTILKKVHAGPNSPPLIERAFKVYSTYRSRADLLRPLVAKLPAGTKTLGAIVFNSPETTLWRPFGARRVLHLRATDTPETIRSRGIEYIAVDPKSVEQIFKTNSADWITGNNAQIIARFQASVLARGEPVEWLLVRIP